MIAIQTEEQFWKNRKSTIVNSTYQNVHQMDDTKPYSVTNLQVTHDLKFSWWGEFRSWTSRLCYVVLCLYINFLMNILHQLLNNRKG
jgi:hypothetical protein